jgi:hypothetical protein
MKRPTLSAPQQEQSADRGKNVLIPERDMDFRINNLFFGIAASRAGVGKTEYRKKNQRVRLHIRFGTRIALPTTGRGLE